MPAKSLRSTRTATASGSDKVPNVEGSLTKVESVKPVEIHDVVTLAIKRLMTLKDLESVAALSKAAIGRNNIDLCEPDAVNELANLIVAAMLAITE